MELRGTELLPHHIRDGVERWVNHGIAPGSFMTAVISNDLHGAMGRADEICRAHLFEIVSFFHNYAPGDCWGSAARFDEWQKVGGLSGLTKAA